MGRLDAKRAIVTGAGRGIGEAVARLFAAEGAAVAVVDREGDRAERVAGAIEEGGGRAVAVIADIATEDGAAAMAEAAAAAFGGIDILDNNAAWIEFGPVHETSLDAWERVLATNLTGVFLASRAVLPHMLAAGSGSIVNMCSINATHGQPGFAAYNASKGGVLGLTRQMAIEYGPAIRVNCVSPGVTDTPAVRNAVAASPDPKGFLEMLEGSNRIALRLGDPAEIAQAVLYLASDESAFCFGTDLMVGGGQAVAP